MLPARSKRYASADGDIPRERLTSGWQLLLLVLVVLTLFYLVFPKKVLVQRLYDQDRLDDLSLSYVQNIYRADTRNADAALLLARHRAQDMDPLDLENMIRPHLRSDDPRQRGIARKLLLIAFQRQFIAATSPAARERLRERVAEVIRLAMDDRMDEDLAHSYAKLAYQLDLMELGSQLLAKFASALTVAELEQLGYEAMGRQEYAKASYYFMLARERSTDLVQIGELLEKAFALDGVEAGPARRWLEHNGIRPIRADDKEDHRRRPVPRMAAGDGIWFARKAETLRALFRGSPFEGDRWMYEMLRHPTARELRGKNVRVGGLVGPAIWLSRADWEPPDD